MAHTFAKCKASELLDADEGSTILVIGPCGWGKDRNAAKALRIAKKHVPTYMKKSAQFRAFNCPTAACVDDMGNIHWDVRQGTIVELGEVR